MFQYINAVTSTVFLVDPSANSLEKQESDLAAKKTRY